MKILFLLNSTIMGGATISFFNMIKGLHENGVKCYVISPDQNMDPEFKQMAEGIVDKYYFAHIRGYVHDDLQYFHGFKKLKKYVKYMIKKTPLIQAYFKYKESSDLDRIVKQVKPDIIHTNVGVLQAGYDASLKYSIPHVWHLREYQTKDFHWEIEPSFNEFVNKLHNSYVIVITKDILNYFRLNQDPKARNIYDGCLDKADAAMMMPKEKYFLCCSRISQEKGHDDVIKAYGLFYPKHPDYKLVIAGFGDTAYIQTLRNKAKSFNCLNGIEFIGFQKDIRPLMKKAKALIVASRFEGFGRMTAEAAICGCLTIGHNTGGTKEILDITGGFPYQGGAVDLEAKMEEVVDMDPSIYQSMAIKAQEKAVQNFSNEANVQGVYNLYKLILSKNQ